MSKLKKQQTTDQKDDMVFNSTDSVLIASSATTAICTGTCILQGITIWKDVDNGTFYFTDADGASITGLPNSTNKAVCDYPGAFTVPRLELSNGLKVVTADCTGIVMSVFVST